MNRQPLRLLYVTQSYYPFMERGGPAVKVRAMARGLARRGHAITVLTADLGLTRVAELGAAPAQQNAQPDRFGWRVEEDGVESIYLPVRASYRAMTWNCGAAAFCRERLGGFDVAHIFGFYDLLGPAVARACRARSPQVPYVVEPMGMYRPIVRSIALKRIYRVMLGDATVRQARRVIATAEQERDELIAEGVPAERVVVRRNGIEPPERLPEPGEFRGKWRIPPDARVVLFLGRLVSKKSPDLLLEAYARWRGATARAASARLVLAGPHEGDGYREQLAALAKRLGVEGEVIFTGPLYDDAKWSSYRDADVFVLPSQNENFGNTAAEAVTCGTPVIVSDQCGIAQLIGNEGAGMVIPHDTGALTAALAQLLDAPDAGALRQHFRDGCAAAAQKLGWSQPLDDAEALYAALERPLR